MAELTLDALMTLVAVGWVDGELHHREASAILRIARAQGLAPEEVQRLEEACSAPVRLAGPEGLPRVERLYLYGLARWIVQVDGVVTSEEDNVVDAVAMALRIGGGGRRAVDAIVERIGAAHGLDPDCFDVAELRRAIASTLG